MEPSVARSPLPGRSHRALGLLIVGSVVYQTAVVLLMHALQPQFSPVRTPVSAYVRGPYGGWLVPTYFAMAAAAAAIALALPATLPPRWLVRIGAILFLLAAAGTVVAGVFPMDAPQGPATQAGRLHALGGSITFPARVVGAVLFALSFRGDRFWGPVYRLSLGLAIAGLVVLLLAIASIVVLGFAGYAQRVLLALMLTWTALVGIRVRRFPGGVPG